jgi:hypothetical protein
MGVWAVGSDDLEFLRLYRGVSRYVDFYTARGVTENQDGNTLFWPPARRIGRRFYVPLRNVCEFFGLTYQIVDVSRDIIPDRQMQVIRIISDSPVNGLTAVGMNRNAIRVAYNEYYSPPPTPSPQPPVGGVPQPPPVVEPPPNYSDVTVHLSFFDISAGSAEGILDLLDLQAASAFHSCFFVSADDIVHNPGLIRRISGTGHTLGIWLDEGTHEEFLNTSALLFEAAKIRSLIVSADEGSELAMEMAAARGLVFWDSARSLVDYTAESVADVTDAIPRESGARMNLMFPCSEDATEMLLGVYSFLRANAYTVARITETVEPVF